MDLVQIIREHHGQVRALFQAFEKATNHRTKERIAKQAILELEVEATAEEEILYPQLGRLDGGPELIAAAEADHHAADAIMLALSELPRGDRDYDAKFASLTQAVEWHMEREDATILPKAFLLDDSLLREVARRIEARKRELIAKTPYAQTGRRSHGGRHKRLASLG